MKILCIEDAEEIRWLIADCTRPLCEAYGAELEFTDQLEMVGQASSYDGLILDVGLPRFDTPAACVEAVRLSKLPVLVYTGRDDPELVEQVAEHGQQFCLKGCDHTEFLLEFERFLQRCQGKLTT